MRRIGLRGIVTDGGGGKVRLRGGGGQLVRGNRGGAVQGGEEGAVSGGLDADQVGVIADGLGTAEEPFAALDIRGEEVIGLAVGAGSYTLPLILGVILREPGVEDLNGGVRDGLAGFAVDDEEVERRGHRD